MYVPVTIAILNWNSREMLAQCIESVKQQTYPAIDLRVLDNDSTDDSVAFLREAYPDIPLTVFEENLGFAKAHNRGIRMTIAPYYMPLNPDAVLTPTYVAEMVSAMELDGRIGMVAGKLLFMTPNGEPTDLLYSTGHLLTRSRSPTNRGYKTRDTGKYGQVEIIFSPNGAAPLYRRAMLDDIALDQEYFCEDFFLYGDDQDLGWRGQLQGWRCVYTPYAIGYHVGFGSGGMRSFPVQVQFTRNRYLTVVRNEHLPHILIDLPFILLYEAIWQASRLRSPKRLLAHWQGLREAYHALPQVLEARRQIEQRRHVSHHYIRSFFSWQLW